MLESERERSKLAMEVIKDCEVKDARGGWLRRKGWLRVCGSSGQAVRGKVEGATIRWPSLADVICDGRIKDRETVKRNGKQ